MVQAIIMAGGEGSRLRPLTCDRPKPMVPMLNKPVMEYTVELLKKYGITDIGVTLQYMPQEVVNYFQNGSCLAVKMRYFVEETPLGTAGSVKNSGDFIKDTFIVISGDALTDFNLAEALDFHRNSGALATLVLTPVDIPLEYGVVITEQTGEIRRFLEKPGWGEVFSDTVNTGIYILEPEIMNYIPQGQKFDFSKDLFPRLLREKKPLFGVSLRGYWCDIGNIPQYREAHYSALAGRVAMKVSGNRLTDSILIGENCRIDPTAVIKGPVVIGDNCQIGREAIVGPEVVVGNHCTIDQHTSVKKTVMWAGAYLGRNVEVRGAVLGQKSVVKDRSMIFEGAVIGDRVILEENVKVKPDIKIWPDKSVETGSVVDKHLIWGTKLFKSLFGTDGISGRVNINLTPEYAAKLGAVFGNVTGAGSSILVSSDTHRSARMIKTAIQAGLVSVGISVLDGGTLLAPVHRHSLRALNVKGGVHVKSSAEDQEALQINFYSGNGTTISPEMERKIENLFDRDDFQRNTRDGIGEIEYIPGLSEAYNRYLLNLVMADRIRNRRFRIMAFFSGENRNIISEVLNELGCEVINTAIEANALNAQVFGDSTETAKLLAGEVLKHGADLGMVFDCNGENVIFIDEKGQVIDREHLVALMSMIIMDKGVKPVIAIPVTGSSVVDKLAEKIQGSVIRTKTAPAAYMKETMNPEVIEAQGPFNQSVMTLDALSSAVKILEYLAEKHTSIAGVISEIPEFYRVTKNTDCSWNAKGKIIRQLVEETKDNQIELLDGLKVFHENGWALILPDKEHPRYNVFSEGASYEFAEGLADFYINRINVLKQSE